MKVCLSVSTLDYPQGGGHRWVFLNWALGLRSNGCEVIWLDTLDRQTPAEQVEERLTGLRAAIGPYGFARSVSLASLDGTSLPPQHTRSCLPLEAAYEADLLLNFNYDLLPEVVGRFRRSALVDLDPGILQTNLANGSIKFAPHDSYFSIGETVGTSAAAFPDAGLRWQHTRPCVAIDYWPVVRAPVDAPFTTISHWWMDEWIVKNDGSYYKNDKRIAFEPFMALPRLAPARFELAINIAGWSAEQSRLEKKGWYIREAHQVAGTAGNYHDYIQQSKGEFSCAKPAYVKLQTAWVSDRTVCYLSSGKPAIVQDTGRSSYLPDGAGLFRFRTLEQARRHVEIVCSDYERQCELARAFAVEHFSADRVGSRLLSSAVD